MDNILNDQTHQADPKMLIIIVELVHKLKRNCYICDLLLLIGTTVLYNVFTEDMKTFAGLELVLILIMGFVQYMLISSKSNFVTKTAIDIKFSKEYIIVSTAAFDGPLWFKKESMEIRFSRPETVAKQVMNPLPKVFKNNNHITKLKCRGVSVYIIPGYFNWRVEEELKQH